MPEEQFDYNLLDVEARGIVQRHTAEIRALARRAAAEIIAIGRRLSEVKAQVGHGHFGPWLAAEFDWNRDTAGRFMAVAQKFGHIPHGAEFAPKALYLLAAPGVPDTARAEALDRAATGELFLALTQGLWQVAPESAQRFGHPAPFPAELAERLIRLYGYPGCHVVDPFGGSGTVGVAAQQLGCRATLVDIDAGYCALAARRCAGKTGYVA